MKISAVGTVTYSVQAKRQHNQQIQTYSQPTNQPVTVQQPSFGSFWDFLFGRKSPKNESEFIKNARKKISESELYGRDDIDAFMHYLENREGTATKEQLQSDLEGILEKDATKIGKGMLPWEEDEEAFKRKLRERYN